MKIRIIDFETTGMPDKRANKIVDVCEVGWTDLIVPGGVYVGSVGPTTSLLLNPSIDIPPEARAVHHISNEMVARAPSSAEVSRILMAEMEPGDMFAAHHAAFEREFFQGGTHSWICTMQCARHLWGDAPGYSNQTLRYWLGLELDEEIAMPPHRAGPDTYVTAHILDRMLYMKSIKSLIELTNSPVLLRTVPFGQHFGKPWEEMDRGFLEWCLDPRREFSEEVKFTARHWLNNRTVAGTPFA